MTIYGTGRYYVDPTLRSHLYYIEALPDYTEAHTLGLFLFDEA